MKNTVDSCTVSVKDDKIFLRCLDSITNDTIVCPYCFYKFKDVWEIDWDYDDKQECYECGKTFSWSRRVDVTFTTRKNE